MIYRIMQIVDCRLQITTVPLEKSINKFEKKPAIIYLAEIEKFNKNNKNLQDNNLDIYQILINCYCIYFKIKYSLRKL